MIRKKFYTLLLALWSISFSILAQVETFPLSTPEEEGIPSESIQNLVKAWESNIKDVHSFMLIRHGKLVAKGWWDPYKEADPHILFSLSKSFTSAAIGFAVQEKLLTVNDKVISFFPDLVPASPSDNLKAMRIKDLLTMSTGQAHDSFGAMAQSEDQKFVKAFLALPVEFKPGTLFIYNTGATYMLSAILQKVTGQKVVDYLKPRLFEPLQISNPQWEESPEGISLGGFGLYLPTEAIAKFGQLYLQKGKWKGNQLLSEEWINQSSSRQVSNGSDPEGNWDQGYGYQFWRNPKFGYRGDGAFGQFCFVLPEYDMVLAITSGTGDMKGIIDLIWEKLLPTLNENPLPENKEALTSLRNKLKSLFIPPLIGKEGSSVAKKISGNTYQLEDNSLGLKSVTLNLDKKNTSVTFSTDQGKETIALGSAQWIQGQTSQKLGLTYRLNRNPKIASSAAWISDDTYETDFRYNETHMLVKVQFKFSGNKIKITGDRNVNFGPTKLPDINGTIKQKTESIGKVVN